MNNIALIGAGGKMGCRITDNLRKSMYKNNTSYVEISPRGIENLGLRGIQPTGQLDAVPNADIVIMAIPDMLMGKITADIVPMMKPKAMLILLDPAAAYLEQLPRREDITYFITHPCHPPVFNDETDPEAKNDFFGGVKAKQSIVCALMAGPEEDYAKGEDVAKTFYGPIIRSHRITIEQMAILEPAMAETVSSTLSIVLKQALEETVKRGVPFEAARDFMLGHINVQLGIVLGDAGFNFSDACLVAIEYGKKHILKEGWEQVFEPESIHEQIDFMLHPERLNQLK
jgi:hypothetical protein